MIIIREIESINDTKRHSIVVQRGLKYADACNIHALLSIVLLFFSLSTLAMEYHLARIPCFSQTCWLRWKVDKMQQCQQYATPFTAVLHCEPHTQNHTVNCNCYYILIGRNRFSLLHWLSTSMVCCRSFTLNMSLVEKRFVMCLIFMGSWSWLCGESGENEFVSHYLAHYRFTRTFRFLTTVAHSLRLWPSHWMCGACMCSLPLCLCFRNNNIIIKLNTNLLTV